MQIINEWCRVDNPFPREYGLYRYPVVESAGNLAERILTDKNTDIYMAVFSQQQLETEMYDTILLDIESQSSHDDVLMAYNYMQTITSYALPTRLYFTGRGFHAYYDLKMPAVGKNTYKYVCQAFVRKYIGNYGYDKVVLGNNRAMARVVGSLNSKAKRFMIKVSPYMSFKQIIKASKIGEHSFWKGNTFDFDYASLECEIAENLKIEVPPKKVIDDDDYPDCIKTAINSLNETKELDAKERLFMASFLLKNNQYDKAYSIIKDNASDFKESYTTYQLNYLKRRNLNVYTCNNVPRWLCPYQNQAECKYFPSINIYMKRKGEMDKNESK